MWGMMTCVLCGKKEQSDPNVQNNWRFIELGHTPLLVCPDHFPEEGAGDDAFLAAYIEVIRRCREIVSGKQSEEEQVEKLSGFELAFLLRDLANNVEYDGVIWEGFNEQLEVTETDPVKDGFGRAWATYAYTGRRKIEISWFAPAHEDDSLPPAFNKPENVPSIVLKPQEGFLTYLDQAGETALHVRYSTASNLEGEIVFVGLPLKLLFSR